MSMIKVFSAGGAYLGDEPAMQIVKLSRKGLLGVDRAAFIKRASASLLQELDQLREKVASDETLVHLLAMGATEDYGANRNGDGFRRCTCQNYHPTFVKYARFYRNHKNKNPQKSYGHIVKSAWNNPMKRVELLVALNSTDAAAQRNKGLLADREMEKLAMGKDIPVSMACGLAGTLVKLRRGFSPIEDVISGDEVLTHRGRYKPVYAVMKRRRQQYARIHTRFCGRQVLEFTPDHEFYVARYEDIPRPQLFNGLRSKDPTGMSKTARRKYRGQLHAHARWLPCGDLKEGDQLLMPIYQGSGQSTLTGDEARVMGYYMAEGSINDGYPQFTCNWKDDCVVELPSLVDTKVTAYQHSASEEACNVCVYDQELGTQLLTEAGRNVRHKTIPQVIYNAPTNIKLEFMSAWFNGDGWQDGKGIHWSTCSRTLSLELQNLLASVGIPASVGQNDHVSDLPNRQPRNGNGLEYVVNVSNRFSAAFATRSKARVIERNGSGAGPFITGNYLAIPVLRVEVVEKEVEVYDLSVEEDESFTAYGLAVHNCKVAYDVCSYCGNRAPQVEDYCRGTHQGGMCKAGGLKDNIGALVEIDGGIHQLHADNPHPTFFDISHVIRPADRIAFVTGALEKAAAARGGVIKSAELARELGLTVPYELMVDGHQPRRVQHLVKLAYQLSDLEAEIEQGNPPISTTFITAFAPTVQGGDEPMPLPPLFKEKFALAMRALVDQRICLPLDRFIEAVADQPREKAAEIAEVAARQLPGIYTRLLGDGRLPERIQGSQFSPADAEAPPQYAGWAAKLATDLSLRPQHIETRVTRAALHQEEAGDLRQSLGHEKVASHEDPTGRLAEEYALYKLAFLGSVPDNDPDLPLTANLVLLQNYAG